MGAMKRLFMEMQELQEEVSEISNELVRQGPATLEHELERQDALWAERDRKQTRIMEIQRIGGAEVETPDWYRVSRASMA